MTATQCRQAQQQALLGALATLTTLLCAVCAAAQKYAALFCTLHFCVIWLCETFVPFGSWDQNKKTTEIVCGRFFC